MDTKFTNESVAALLPERQTISGLNFTESAHLWAQRAAANLRFCWRRFWMTLKFDLDHATPRRNRHHLSRWKKNNPP